MENYCDFEKLALVNQHAPGILAQNVKDESTETNYPSNILYN